MFASFSVTSSSLFGYALTKLPTGNWKWHEHKVSQCIWPAKTVLSVKRQLG